MNYFKNKDQNIKHAHEHISEMQDKYAEDIWQSIHRSIVFERGRDLELVKNNPAFSYNANTDIQVVNADTVKALYDFYCSKGYSPRDTVVLNFASFKNPGGMFLRGSMAQEEFLCHNSTLFNVISAYKFDDYYKENCKNVNKSLYRDKLIYSPGVVFEADIPFKDGIKTDNFQCGVITCAAPNASAASKYHQCTSEDIDNALKSRIEYVLHVANVLGIRNLVLGAFGCGVFGNDPIAVAGYFRSYLKTT